MSESLRPLYHFAPRQNWINDPNGPIWLDGEYHLFFQYNPYGDVWGHMSWGHAVSTDLVHWQELPLAIPEDRDYMIFSGSVVFDAGNTAGFAPPGQGALVAIYTGAAQPPRERQNQQLAYSLDRGLTWTKYAGNPVLDIGVPDFRDPKVFWHAPSARWVMVVVRSDLRHASFYASTDLKDWIHLSDFGPTHPGDGIWECPDLFPLTLPATAGRPQRTVWVFKVDIFENHPAGGSGNRVYFGAFDGVRFRCAPEAHQWTDWGMDFYACASWNGLPAASPGGPPAPEAIWIGWEDNHRYARDLATAPWRGQMSIPRTLALGAQDGHLVLLQQPVAALAALRQEVVRLGPVTLTRPAFDVRLPAGTDARALDIEMVLSPAGRCGIALRVGQGERTEIGYDAGAAALFIDRSRSGQAPPDPAWTRPVRAPCRADGDGLLRLRVLLDSSSVEVLTQDGSVWLSQRILPGPTSLGVELWADGAAPTFETVIVYAIAP